MSKLPPLFMTSGDLIADRRVELARQYQAAGDVPAAADLFVQAVERAPQFAWAWFLLGEALRELGDQAGAIAAYAHARTHDVADRLGAGLQLARLSAADPAAAMSGGYVRALFDQYAPRFDAALAELDYRAPQLLFDAVMATGRAHFDRALDLGCGTGLAARAFAPNVDAMHGVDLSIGMIAQAERTGLYGSLAVDDMLAFLLRQNDASADLVIAADALVYLADLAPTMREVGRVLARGGLFCFTVETHPAEGVILSEKLRYAHGADHVRAALAQAGFGAMTFAGVSTRNEAGAPVPGLLVVAQ